VTSDDVFGETLGWLSSFMRATSLGKVNRKVAPGPELEVAHRPPCDSMIESLMVNPVPVLEVWC
jgi:hypothetical protein